MEASNDTNQIKWYSLEQSIGHWDGVTDANITPLKAGQGSSDCIKTSDF